MRNLSARRQAQRQPDQLGSLVFVSEPDFPGFARHQRPSWPQTAGLRTKRRARRRRKHCSALNFQGEASSGTGATGLRG